MWWICLFSFSVIIDNFLWWLAIKKSTRQDSDWSNYGEKPIVNKRIIADYIPKYGFIIKGLLITPGLGDVANRFSITNKDYIEISIPRPRATSECYVSYAIDIILVFTAELKIISDGLAKWKIGRPTSSIDQINIIKILILFYLSALAAWPSFLVRGKSISIQHEYFSWIIILSPHRSRNETLLNKNVTWLFRYKFGIKIKVLKANSKFFNSNKRINFSFNPFSLELWSLY